METLASIVTGLGVLLILAITLALVPGDKAAKEVTARVIGSFFSIIGVMTVGGWILGL